MIDRLAGQLSAAVVSSGGGEPKSEAALKDGSILMVEQTHSISVHAGKRLVRPLPVLNGDLKVVADTVTTWPEVIATSRSHFACAEQNDGSDFRVGDDELGHMHFDGSIHLASGLNLCAALVAEGLGRPSPWARGWFEARVQDLGVERAVALFRRSYDRLRPSLRRGEAGPQAVRLGTDSEQRH